MPKLKKHQLSFDNDYDYDLIGICSHYSDYRLVWSMNEALGLSLEKGRELFLVSGKKVGETKGFPNYEMIDEEAMLQLYLIKNAHERKYLIPEKQQIDYFLFICDNVSIDVDAWVNKLREIDGVMAAYAFDPTEFASTEQIVF
ncbi:MAG: IPExxxVDY family protein [Bacteroidetes bacterium]|nr:MAG: IPExxxVDY family protein [Bacteroidota bacterium]